MQELKSVIDLDRIRYKGKKLPLWQFFWRKSQISHSVFSQKFYWIVSGLLKRSRGIEISKEVDFGPGAYFGHDYLITINGGAKLGKNINIHKGVTIGQENRGKRKGIPSIGDDVWIGINSTIVGNVTIGNDVLIAPNSFVNKDVPSHSVVIGNPCTIHPKENATEGYINNRI